MLCVFVILMGICKQPSLEAVLTYILSDYIFVPISCVINIWISANLMG